MSSIGALNRVFWFWIWHSYLKALLLFSFLYPKILLKWVWILSCFEVAKKSSSSQSLRRFLMKNAKKRNIPYHNYISSSINIINIVILFSSKNSFSYVVLNKIPLTAFSWQLLFLILTAGGFISKIFIMMSHYTPLVGWRS